MGWWDNDPVVSTNQAPNDSGDWWKKDQRIDQAGAGFEAPKPSASYQPPEVAQFDEQQAMERNAASGRGHYLDALAVGLDKSRNIGTEALSAFSPEMSARVFGQTTESLRPEQIAPPIISPENAKQIVGTLPEWAGGNTQFGQGVSESSANALSSFSAPGALAQLPAFALPGVSEAYVLNLLSELPDQGRRLLETASKYGWGSKETGKLAAEYGITDSTGFLAGKHSTLKRGIAGELNARAGEVPKEHVPQETPPSVPPVAQESISTTLPEPVPPPNQAEVELSNQSVFRQESPRLATLAVPSPDITKGGTEVNAPSVQEPPLASTQGEFPPKANPETQGVPRPVQGQAFVPSTEWQEVPPNTVLPNGGEYRMDQVTGKSFARWKAENLPPTMPEALPVAEPPANQPQPAQIHKPAVPSSGEISAPLLKQSEVSQPETKLTSTGIATGIERVSDDPFVSRIANRFTQERATQGEIGEIAPGQGYATSDLVSRGLKMAPEEIAQHVSDVMRDSGNDPVLQAAAIRAEEARLSDRSTELSRIAESDLTNLGARQAANSAFQDLTDFHNGPVAKLKQRFHATGMALQGEIPVDLSTINGLREAWLKENGSAPPSKMDQTFRRTAENVRRSTGDERAVMDILGREIDRASSKRKLPTAEEVRNRIMERMKEQPCRV